MKVIEKKQLKLYDMMPMLRGDMIELIKEHFTENDKVYLDYNENYGSILISMCSEYEREETREEKYKREMIEEGLRKDELKEYKRLKKKFGF